MHFLKSFERVISRAKQILKMCRLLNKFGQNECISTFQEYSDPDNSIGEESPIWCIWWQGENNMPEIVKACYNTILRHARKHPVILITEENMDEYIKLPEYIMAKYRDGIISRTHFSDIARMYLLKEYGGIWTDITNYFTKDIDEIVDTSLSLWTYRHVTLYNNVSRGLWTSFFIASGKHSVLPEYIFDSLLHWWKNNDKLIDYLLLDYVFKSGYDNILQIKSLIDALPTKTFSMMRKSLHREYNAEEWEKLCSVAPFHKLSYKKYTEKHTKNGLKTFYAHILDICLNM